MALYVSYKQQGSQRKAKSVHEAGGMMDVGKYIQ